MFPMDRHAMASHDAGAGKDEGPAGHAADTQAPLRQLSQPCQGRAMSKLRRIAARADQQ